VPGAGLTKGILSIFIAVLPEHSVGTNVNCVRLGCNLFDWDRVVAL